MKKKMFGSELITAISAVKSAVEISKIIQNELLQEETITKSDRSPVTIADFVCQATVCNVLNTKFPDIPIVAEENSKILRKPENVKILEKIINYLELNPSFQKKITPDKMFEMIDYGKKEPSNIFWTLDPVDGTKGFLRKEQYAIALALIVNGEVETGILGCPNLSLDNLVSHSGLLFYAEKGHGSNLLNLDNMETCTIKISNIKNPNKMRLVQSYESAHSNFELQSDISNKLNILNTPFQIDSQAKYGVISSGNAELYLRIPNIKTPDYKEKIWDHAAGKIVFEEAGGVVSDIFGEKLDFSQGRTLNKNSGVIASVPAIHSETVQILQSLL